MDKIDALDAFNRDLLSRYAERCITRVTGRRADSLPLSLSVDHLRENVEKEARKDRLVLEAAANAHRRGQECTAGDIEELFSRSKDIDQQFLRAMVIPSLAIHVRYDDVAVIRKKRFRHLAAFAADVLDAWPGSEPFPDVIRRLYSAEQFSGIVGELLFLYCVETKKLAASVRFCAPFNRAMDQFIDEVVESMEDERRVVAVDVCTQYFSGPPSTHPPRARFSSRLFPFIRN